MSRHMRTDIYPENGKLVRIGEGELHDLGHVIPHSEP